MRFVVPLLLAAASPAFAQDTVGVRARPWRADFSGTIRADDNGTTGTEVDVEAVLDIEQSEDLKGASFWIGAPAAGRIYVDYWWGAFEGDQTLTSNVTFAGTTFSSGDEVRTEFEWRCLTAVYDYGYRTPLVEKLVDLRLGVRLGAKYIRIRGDLDSPTVSETAKARGPIPVLGASAEIFLTQVLSVEAAIDGLHVSSWEEGFRGTIYDATVCVRGGFNGVFVGIGYRLFHMDLHGERADVDEVEFEFDIEGAFLEAGVRF